MDQPRASIATLQRRGELLRALRDFFYDRSFIEVETPLLASEVIPEHHIDPVRTASKYLQSSPELHMKRLVAEGMLAIFQVTRSFRDNEFGALHNPEFAIVEWYRVGDDMHAGMQLLDELCQKLLGTAAARRTSYAAAFSQFVGMDAHRSTAEQLAAQAKQWEVAVPDNMPQDDRDQWLNLLLASRVEAELGRAGPEILDHYPASQAALAKTVTRDDGINVAERFELYWQGVELANGYHELTDAKELRKRLNLVNTSRQADGKEALPMPENLLTAMTAGLPACTGCALGFDRLAMLACGAKTISEVSALVGDET